MTTLRVDVWSDIACPWCYVGKRRLEAALAKFPHKDEVEIVWRAFELDPSAPKTLPAGASPWSSASPKKYRSHVAQAQAQLDRVVAVGAGDEIDFRFDRMQPSNTFDAHRLLHFAHEHAKQDALKERLFRAYMTDGQAMIDQQMRSSRVRDVGLDEAAARDVLASDRYAREVRGDEQLASQHGIMACRSSFFADKLAVSGAQPADVLRSALERGWAEASAAKPLEMAVGGPACGFDGCD